MSLLSKFTICAVLLSFVLPSFAIGTSVPQSLLVTNDRPSAGLMIEDKRSAAYDWLDIALEVTAREHDRVAPRPTVGSRMLMLIVACMYEAWAPYDDKAVGVVTGGDLRRPPAERTLKNKEIAIGFATYRAMMDIFP